MQSTTPDDPDNSPYTFENLSDAPDLNTLTPPSGKMPAILHRFQTDLRSLERKYPLALSPVTYARKRRFLQDWLTALETFDFEGLNREDRIDYLLLRNHLHFTLRRLDQRRKEQESAAPLLPFASALLGLEEARRRMEWADSAQSASALHTLEQQITQTKQEMEAQLPGKNPESVWEPMVVHRAAQAVPKLRDALKDWFTFYNGYDPLFSWWTETPYKAVDTALEAYGNLLKENTGGIKPDEGDPIVGNPLGREALQDELAFEMIPYTPEELIAMAEKQWAWCEREMRRAAADLGYGDDWHAALEHVKTLHEAPGGQPELIRHLAVEAIDYLLERDLLTIPPLARETWRMTMMSPEKQLVNPFFLGGEVIQVSFPTNAMTHAQKQMSMRGNNPHFARATVQHELIPGHHLQFYMLERYRTHRRPLGTPFWIEGWAIYWELLLWEKGFPQSPENRIGMLFWRMHRCVRIIFSLGFHLNQVTSQECIDMLVDRVGHERANAVAEVRRSFNGDYPPLYQCAYLLGGLQLWALRKELVETGKMTERDFHDRVIQQNSIPIEMVRADLTQQELSRDFVSNWKF